MQGIYSSFGHVGGPAIGGILIASVGLTATYAIDVVTFSASLVAAALLPKMPPLGKVARPGLRAIAEGFQLVRRKPELKGIFVVDSIAMVFGMPSALFPAIGEHFGGGAETVGFLYAAPYAGALVATLLSGWVSRARRQGLGVCIAASAWGRGDRRLRLLADPLAGAGVPRDRRRRGRLERDPALDDPAHGDARLVTRTLVRDRAGAGGERAARSATSKPAPSPR